MKLTEKILIPLCFILGVTTYVEPCWARLRFGSAAEWTVVNDDNENQFYLEYVRFITVPHSLQGGTIFKAGDNVEGKSDGEIAAIIANIKDLENVPAETRENHPT